jgi:hypothetical protein
MLRTMKPSTACLIIALSLGGGFAAPAIAQGQLSAAPRFSNPRAITNSYLPLQSLKRDILTSKGERVERTVRPDLQKAFQMGDQKVEALVVEDREFAHGKLSEVALDYFAQADDGTVYYLGEDVDQYRNGKVVGHEGSWLLGKQTWQLGVLMPPHPKVGDRFRSEDVPGVTREDDEVLSVSETVTVAAGTYQNCVKIKEHLSDGKTEYKFYAPGTGCVKEAEFDGALELQEHQANNLR